MTKVDIISGFLGAGKTTLIKKLIQEVFAGQKIVLIENEFGEIGIDGGFLKEAGINITEMNSGCICCSLVGDFGKALKEVTDKFAPDRIIIEPSGVGKLSDVKKAVEDAAEEAGLVLNALTTVADASKIKLYMKNFGEFYNNQIENAATVILSRTQKISEEKQLKAAEMIREKNPDAVIITTPWEELSGEQILNAMEKNDVLAQMLLKEAEEHRHHHEHGEECGCGHHHDHDEECGCGHHHDHDEECGCGHHHHDHDEECSCGHHHHEHDEECGCSHHHEHGEECSCGCHDHEHHEHHHHEHGEGCSCGCHDHEHHEHHHHEHGEGCSCGCHDHEHHEHHHHEHGEGCSCGCHDHEHHHHHADEVFTSWGKETPKKFTEQEIENILNAFDAEDGYGIILRAKGMVPCTDGSWIHFDYVPGEYEIRKGAADYTGRLCVIGSDINDEKLTELFNL